MKKLIRSETIFSILAAIFLYSIVLIIFMQWQFQQHQQSLFNFQKQQALQIAENQIALKLSGGHCNSRVVQNDLIFNIVCKESGIQVRFPLGEIMIGKVK